MSGENSNSINLPFIDTADDVIDLISDCLIHGVGIKTTIDMLLTSNQSKWQENVSIFQVVIESANEFSNEEAGLTKCDCRWNKSQYRHFF